MESRVKCSILFDKRNAGYSWGLPALWHFTLSKFVSFAQICVNLKLAMDIKKKCVYNTTYAAGLMPVVLSHIISGWGDISEIG